MTAALSLRRSVSEVKVNHALSSVPNLLLDDTVELGSEFCLSPPSLCIGQLVKGARHPISLCFQLLAPLEGVSLNVVYDIISNISGLLANSRRTIRRQRNGDDSPRPNPC